MAIKHLVPVLAFFAPAETTGASVTSGPSTEAELGLMAEKDAEIARLKAQLAKAKGETPGVGIITLSDKTKDHPEFLARNGYRVTVEDGTLHVECNGFVKEMDLSGPDAVEKVKAIIKAKKLFTYSTRFTFTVPKKDGTGSEKVVRWSVMALKLLGKASALVTSPQQADEETQATPKSAEAVKSANPFDAI